MTRKNLDGLIHGDRADVRAAKKSSLGGSTLYTFSGNGTGARCYQTHKALKLPGSDFSIHGGSCITPAIKDAQVYIGFDRGMTFAGNKFPWNGAHDVYFPVNDMRAPSNPGEFKKLVAWTLEQLQAGKKVHAGCIGGHGRTGTFFSALVATLGETDATGYVRTHYCHRAVESAEQIKFLAKHFGVKESHGSKSSFGYGGDDFSLVTGPAPKHKVKASTVGGIGVETFTPLPNVSIWD